MSTTIIRSAAETSATKNQRLINLAVSGTTLLLLSSLSTTTFCLTAQAQLGQEPGDWLRGQCFSEQIWQFKPAGPENVTDCRDACKKEHFPGFMMPTGPNGDADWGCRCCEMDPIDLTLSEDDPHAIGRFVGMPINRSAGEKDHWRVYNTDENVPLVGQNFSYEERVKKSHCLNFNPKFGDDGLGRRYDLQDCATDVGLIWENSGAESDKNGDFTTFMWSDELTSCRVCGAGLAGADGGEGHYRWTTYTLMVNSQPMADPVQNYKYQDSLYRGACYQTKPLEDQGETIGDLNQYDNLQDCVNMANVRGCEVITWDPNKGYCRCCAGNDGLMGVMDGLIQYSLPNLPCAGGEDCKMPPAFITCPAGEERDPATNTCRPTCPAGTERNPVTDACETCANGVNGNVESYSGSEGCTIQTCKGGYNLVQDQCQACGNQFQVATWSSSCTIETCLLGYGNVNDECQLCTNYAQVANWSTGCIIAECVPGFWVVEAPDGGNNVCAAHETLEPIALPADAPPPADVEDNSDTQVTTSDAGGASDDSGSSWVSDWPYQGTCGANADPVWDHKYFGILETAVTWDAAAERCALYELPRINKRIIDRGLGGQRTGRGPRQRGDRPDRDSRHADHDHGDGGSGGSGSVTNTNTVSSIVSAPTDGTWLSTQSLAQPGSREEVIVAYNSSKTNTPAPVWLGIRFHDGKWREGSTLNPSTLPGLSALQGQDGDCLALTFDNGDVDEEPTYTSYPCDTTLFYMCEGCETSSANTKAGLSRFFLGRRASFRGNKKSRRSRRRVITRKTRRSKADRTTNQALSAESTTSAESAQCRVGALSCVVFYALLAAAALGLVVGTLALMYVFFPRQCRQSQVVTGMGTDTAIGCAPKQFQ